MKYLTLLLLALCFSVGLKAQVLVKDQTGKFVVSKVIEFPGLTDTLIYVKAINYSKDKKENFYFSNDKLKDRKWAYGRGKWGNPELYYGYGQTDPVSKEITGKVFFVYESSPDGCIKLFTVSADYIIQTKTGKSRIMLENFRYVNYSIKLPPAVVEINGGNKICKAAGPLEEYADCTACDITKNNIFSFLNESIEKLFSLFAADIPATNGKKNNDW